MLDQCHWLVVKRAVGLLADELRAMVLHSGLGDAMGLLPALQLAGCLGVSSSHLCEALRLLEQDGLVKVRPGRNGGVLPAGPGGKVLTRTCEGFLATTITSVADLMAARLMVATAMAGLVCRHILGFAAELSIAWPGSALHHVTDLLSATIRLSAGRQLLAGGA